MHYSAVIDAGGRRLRLKSLVRRLYGFRDCKVKVGREGDDDAAAAAARFAAGSGRASICGSTRMGPGERAKRREKLASLAASRISCVEQPLAHEEFSALADLRRQVVHPRDARRIAHEHGRCGSRGRTERLRSVQHPALEVRRLPGELAAGGVRTRARTRLPARLPSWRDGHLVGGRAALGRERRRHSLSRRLVRSPPVRPTC